MDHTMRGNPHPNYRNCLNRPHGHNKIIPEKSKSELDFCMGRGMTCVYIESDGSVNSVVGNCALMKTQIH